MARPEVRLEVHGPTLASRDVTCTVVITAESSLAIDGITLSVAGRATVERAGRRHHWSVFEATKRLAGSTRTEPGEHSFASSFSLPPDAPPTHYGRMITTCYEASIQVEIPWGRDVKKRVEIFVPPWARRPLEPTPQRWKSEDDSPQLEASVVSRTVAPGDTITGAFALATSGVDCIGSSVTLVTLVAQERFSDMVERWNIRSTSLGHPPTDGSPIPFRFPVPQASPSWEAQGMGLDYELRFEPGLRLDGSTVLLHCPIEIDAAPPSAKQQSAPPAIGSARFTATWQKAASELGFTLTEGSLRRDGPVEVMIRRELTVGSMYLVGHLRFASFDLGLSYDQERGEVRANDESQLEGVRRALGLRRAKTWLDFIDDTSAILRLPDQGRDVEKIVGFGKELVAIADALEECRATIPPPASFTPFLANWMELAQRLDGRLEIARMRVIGVFRGGEASIETTWWRGPRGTRVTLRPPRPPEPFSVGRSRGASDAPEHLRARIDTILERVPFLAVDRDGVIAVELDDPIIDPRPLLDLLRRLDELGSVDTPYR